MSAENLHILYLTRWYPHKADPQLGIFIRKHARAASQYCRVSVLNVRAVTVAAEKLSISKNEELNFSETIVNFLASPNRFINFLRYVKAHYAGFEAIAKSYGKPQLIQLNVMYGLCLITLILHYKKQIPYIIAEHWHGFIDHKFEKKSVFLKKLFRYTASHAKAIITVSEFLKKGMMANGLSSKYYVIPNVVENFPSAVKTSTGEINMLTVADLDDDIKNISGVINALSDIIHSGNINIKYHIIGSGKDEAYLKKLAHLKGLSNDQIIFYGLRDNDFVLHFLNEIDFVIINSRYETFSIIAAESLLAGKPLVCTNCGGVADFVDRDCGYLIEPGDEKELTRALTLMMSTYSDFNSDVLKQKVNNRFSANVIGNQLYNIYQSTIANHQL